MPTPFTPSAQLGASDPPLPDGPPSNAATHRELLNARRHLRGATWGALVWNERLRVSGSSNTVFSVVVGPIEVVTLRDSGSVWRPYFTSGDTTLDLTHVEGTPANLANDTFYYVYIWSDAAAAGSAKFQISTSPPTEVGTEAVRRAWKRGQTANYRYLGWFRTNGSGVPLAMHADRGRYLYALPAVLHTVTATGLVSLAARLPPHVQRALLRASVTRASGTGDISGGVYEPGGSANSHYGWLVIAYGVAELTTFAGSFEILTNASQQVHVQSGGADSAVLVTVAGCEE